MKYVSANDILPQDLLSLIQTYYQGGYLYIPKGCHHDLKRQTDYKIELEKRNQYIFLKHLEGRTNEQIGKIYHLSESSVRRIILKEKAKYQNMREVIEKLLPLWGVKSQNIQQIYPSAWEINDSYVIKVYDDQSQLDRNIRIAAILSDCRIPVAEAILTKTGETYITQENSYFYMSKKLPGKNISDIKEKEMSRKMGYAIAQLHRAFLKCEKEITFWDNSLLREMKGWIQEVFAADGWQTADKAEYSKAVTLLEDVYDHLPKQLIHRDVHFGNFLFFEGNLSGYIDFDLSQRNIRIFDICYFLAGLLAEETEEAFTKSEWLEHVRAMIKGYESIFPLSEIEKGAISCVMECIELLFTAYYIRIKDIKHAHDAYHIFHFIQSCENDLKEALI